MSISMKLIIGAALITAIFVSSPLQAGDKDVVVINTPDVNVANVPDVSVTNDETSPIPVTIQSGARPMVEWRYIGLTIFEDDGHFEFDGSIGVAALHKACAAQFGPTARAATISEAFFRTNPSADSRRAWLAPDPRSHIIAARDTEAYAETQRYTAVDAATGRPVGQGISPPPESGAFYWAYCAAYTDANDFHRAPTSVEFGNILSSICSEPHPVACSAPVAVPVTTLP